MAKKVLKGIAASPGVAMGTVCIYSDIFSNVPPRTIEDGEIGAEIQKVKESIGVIQQAIKRDQEKVMRQAGADANIFSTHLSMIEDSHFMAEIFEKIATQKMGAAAAVLAQIRRYEEVFSKIEDGYLKDRILDIRDIGKRLLESLIGPAQFDCPFREPIIVAGMELTPKHTVQHSREHILAFVAEQGGRESHAAILARSMGIPAVLGVEGILSRIQKGDFLIVDGNLGFVVVNPPDEVVREYRETQKRISARREKMEALIPRAAETSDGHPFRLMANIGCMVDLEFAIHYQAEGIGLFRTELPFIIGGRTLSEEDQLDLYRNVVQRMKPREVTIRTFDFGGDKFLNLPHPEKNPFLGYRSTRIFLQDNALLKRQLKAVMIAAVNGNVRIMSPMVSTIEEVRQIRKLVREVEQELVEQRMDFRKGIPVGVMVEVPSLAIMAQKVMKEVDFVSIGTNDLIQYTLAVDRDNRLVNHLYEPLNPSVLWLMKNVVDAGKAMHKSVSICGEIAGDPVYFPLLFGLGLREFSVAPISLLEIKEAAKWLTEENASRIAGEALGMDSSKEIEGLLRRSSLTSERPTLPNLDAASKAIV